MKIYSIFYELFSQNYIAKEHKNDYRIFHRANFQKLALINENTKFLLLVDKNGKNGLENQKLLFLTIRKAYNNSW